MHPLNIKILLVLEFPLKGLTPCLDAAMEVNAQCSKNGVIIFLHCVGQQLAQCQGIDVVPWVSQQAQDRWR